jgi:hypothetical protein
MTDLKGIDVIDWDEAMQQCGDDEEFLRELLGDLRDETDSQMTVMEEVIQVCYVLGSLVTTAVVLQLARRGICARRLEQYK